VAVELGEGEGVPRGPALPRPRSGEVHRRLIGALVGPAAQEARDVVGLGAHDTGWRAKKSRIRGTIRSWASSTTRWPASAKAWTSAWGRCSRARARKAG